MHSVFICNLVFVDKVMGYSQAWRHTLACLDHEIWIALQAQQTKAFYFIALAKVGWVFSFQCWISLEL